MCEHLLCNLTITSATGPQKTPPPADQEEGVRGRVYPSAGSRVKVVESRGILNTRAGGGVGGGVAVTPPQGRPGPGKSPPGKEGHPTLR